MSRAATIELQREHGLISAREARSALRHLARQSQFNADYSDTLAGFTRWSNERDAARVALEVIQ